MTFFLVTIRHDQECDIIEFVDLLFPWAWSCTRLFSFVKFDHRIHPTKSKFPPAQYIVLVASSLNISVRIVRAFGMSVLLIYYVTNPWSFLSIAGFLK